MRAPVEGLLLGVAWSDGSALLSPLGDGSRDRHVSRTRHAIQDTPSPSKYPRADPGRGGDPVGRPRRAGGGRARSRRGAARRGHRRRRHGQDRGRRLASSAETLTRARPMGVGGIVLGGVLDKELRDSEAIQRRRREVGGLTGSFGVLLVEGFGKVGIDLQRFAWSAPTPAGWPACSAPMGCCTCTTRSSRRHAAACHGWGSGGSPIAAVPGPAGVPVAEPQDLHDTPPGFRPAWDCFASRMAGWRRSRWRTWRRRCRCRQLRRVSLPSWIDPASFHQPQRGEPRRGALLGPRRPRPGTPPALTGPPGAGNTQLAKGVAQEWRRTGCSSSAPPLLDERVLRPPAPLPRRRASARRAGGGAGGRAAGHEGHRPRALPSSSGRTGSTCWLPQEIGSKIVHRAGSPPTPGRDPCAGRRMAIRVLRPGPPRRRERPGPDRRHPARRPPTCRSRWPIADGTLRRVDGWSAGQRQAHELLPRLARAAAAQTAARLDRRQRAGGRHRSWLVHRAAGGHERGQGTRRRTGPPDRRGRRASPAWLDVRARGGRPRSPAPAPARRTCC